MNLRDLTGNVNLSEAAKATMAVANAIQNFPDKGARLMAMSCSFLLAAEEAGINIPDLITMARNCMNTAEGIRPEFKAVEDYIHYEIFN